MRNQKALDNIRAVIEQHEADWLKDNGFDPVRRPQVKPKRELTFSEGRFLGTESALPITPPIPEPEPQDTMPEIREIFPPKEGHHSWLYKEVVKAIHDAASDDRNTKIVAVFIPVVRNGREFEDLSALPNVETVELSPVNEDDVNAAQETENKAWSVPEPGLDADAWSMPEPMDDVANIDAVSVPAENVEDMFPAGQREPDPELAQAFHTMEEKLDESIAEAEEHNVSFDEQEQVDFDEAFSPEKPDDEIIVDDELPEFPELPELEDSNIVIDGTHTDEVPDLLPLPDPSELDELPEFDGDILDEEEEKGVPMTYVETDIDVPMPEELKDDEIDIEE